MTILQEAQSTEQELLEPVVSNVQLVPNRSVGSFLESILEVLQVPTGPGSLEEYKKSPLNFDGSEGLARILRGAAGFIGADFLRSAMLDVLIGLFQWVSERRRKPIAQS